MRSAELTLPGFRHDICSAIHPLGVALAVPAHAAARRARRRVDPAAGPARAPSRRRHRGRCSSARSRAPAPALGADGTRLASGSWGRSSATPTRSLAGRCSAPPRRRGTRSRSRASGCSALRSATASRALASTASGHARSSPGSPRTRCCRSRRPPTRRVRARCSRCSATRSAGRFRAAARRRSPTRSPSYLRSLGGEIETGRRSRRSASSREAHELVLLDVTPRQLLALAGDGLPAALPARARALPLRPRRLQGRLGARRARCPGAARSVRRAATVHLGGTLDGDRRGRGRRRERPASRSARTSSSPSRASSTRRGRRPASTRSGPTATSRTARPST